MKFVCERCHTKYSIADEKVRGKVLKVRCKTCTNVITVRETGATIDDQASADVPREAPLAQSGGYDAFAGSSDGDTVVSPRAALLGQVGGRTAAGRPAATRATAQAAAPLPEEALFAPSAPVAAPPPKRVAPPPPPVVEVEWYLAIDGAQTGPFSRARLVDKIAATAKGADVHIWNADFDGWKPPHDVAEIHAELMRRRPPGPPAPPPANRRHTGGGMPAAASGAGEGGLMMFETNGAGHKNGVVAATAAAVTGTADVLGGTGFGDLLGGETPAGPARLTVAPAVLLPQPAGLSQSVGTVAPKSSQAKLIFASLGVVVVLCGIVSVWMFRRPAVNAAVNEPAPVKAAVATDFNALAAKLKAEQEAAKPAEKPPEPPPAVAPVEQKQIVARLDPPVRKGKQARRRPNQTTPPPMTAGGLTAEQREAAERFSGSSGREVRVPTAGQSSARSMPAQADISRVINNNRQGIQTCYQRALLRDNTLTNGKVTVRVSIGLSGKVKSVNLDAPAQFRALEPCIRDVMSRWAFPPSSEEYGTEFPVVLQGNQ